MALNQILILPTNRLPSGETIQKLSTRQGFTTDRFDTRKHTGFLPVRIETRLTGFEYYFGMLDKKLSRARPFGDAQITTRFGDNLYEMLASSLFLKLVASISGGAYFDTESNTLVPPPKAQQALDQLIAAVRSSIR